MLTKIIPGGFKQFNNTLTKTRIQTGSSSGYFKRLFVQSWRPQIKMKSKVFQNPFQTTTGFENIGESSVGCLKITEDKALNADLYKREGHSQLRHESQSDERGPHHEDNVRVTFNTWRDTHASLSMKLTRAWVASRFNFKREHVAPHSNSNATLRSLWAPRLATERGPRPTRDPHFCCNWPYYWIINAHIPWGVNPHYGGILGDNSTLESPYK